MFTYHPSLKNGQRVRFNLRDIGVDEFPDMEELIQQLDGQNATIMEFDLAAAGEGDEAVQDFEYYTIRFDSGVDLQAISGYHLTLI